MEFARGEIARLDELRWVATERRVDLVLRLGRHGDTIGLLAELVRQDAVARAIARAARARPVPVGPPGRRPARLRGRPADAGGGARHRAGRGPARPRATHPPTGPIAGLGASRRAAPPAAIAVEPSPPARATSGRLPVPVSALVGRDATDHPARTPRSNVTAPLTLTGPAGAGKTRLAIEVAARNRSPVCYVDFSPIDDPALVAPTVAAAAGVTIAPGDDPVAAIAETLASREVLVVLDTCEHVVGRSGPARVGRVAHGARCADARHQPAPARCLRRVRLAGATPRLCHRRTPSARMRSPRTPPCALFVERATAVSPGSRGRRHRRRRHRRRVHRARRPATGHRAGRRPHRRAEPGGHPVPARGPLRAARRRRRRMSPSGSRRCARPSTGASSCCRAPQRTFFARLGAFAGTFGLDAALIVAGHGSRRATRVAGVAREAVDGGPGRSRSLPAARHACARTPWRPSPSSTPTTPETATPTSTCGWPSRARCRSAAPTSSPGSSSFRSDINNLRAALEWCLLTGDITRAARLAGALAWFWTLNGMLTEAIQHLERLVDVADVPPPIRARCLWGYALLAASLGRLETARDAGYRAAEVARGVRRRRRPRTGSTPPRSPNGRSATTNDHLMRTAKRSRCSTSWTTAGDWPCATCSSPARCSTCDDPAADAVAATGVDHARRAGDRHVLGIALTQIAQIAIADGDARAAVSAASEALALQELIGYTEGIVSALHVLGQAHRLRGDLDAARDHHRRALALASRIGHAAAMCEAIEDLARDEAVDRPDLAATLLHAARAERDAVGASRCVSGTPRSLPTSNGRCTAERRHIRGPQLQRSRGGDDDDDRPFDPHPRPCRHGLSAHRRSHPHGRVEPRVCPVPVGRRRTTAPRSAHASAGRAATGGAGGAPRQPSPRCVTASCSPGRSPTSGCPSHGGSTGWSPTVTTSG